MTLLHKTYVNYFKICKYQGLSEWQAYESIKKLIIPCEPEHYESKIKEIVKAKDSVYQEDI